MPVEFLSVFLWHYFCMCCKGKEGCIEMSEEKTLTKEEKEDILKRINHTLDKIRPYLQAEGGDVTLVDFEDGVATVDMIGACAGCMMASADVTEGVQALIVDEVPEVMKVVMAPQAPQFYY